MPQLSLKIPTKLSAKLDRAARRRQQTKSDLVRVALEQFLDERRRENGDRSAIDLAGDLVGCAKGPADLSTNPQHLGGYGK
jgi:Arc/MetJ-type ribon-helix-helix transcriptional regulator